MTQRRAAFFQDKKCVECGSIEDLELDHVDPSTKVSHRIWTWSEVRRNEELAKCQILCRSCHQKKTAQENQTAQHGTDTMYSIYKCRCEDCRQARAAAKAATRAKRKLLGLPYQ